MKSKVSAQSALMKQIRLKVSFRRLRFGLKGMHDMTREKMLEVLGDLPFAMIDPESWDDVGFTEREIWVNDKGYGYIACDEPTAVWEGQGLSAQEWGDIKPKIMNGSLTYIDIAGTALEDLLDSLGYDCDCIGDDFDYVINDLKGLLTLPHGPCGYFCAMATFDEPQYFDQEAAFRAAYERDWADVLWNEMSDDLLAEWINRLCTKYADNFADWIQKHGLRK